MDLPLNRRPEMYPFKAPALELTQPLGAFLVTVIPAKVLLDCCFSERLRATRKANGYTLEGSQRLLNTTRLRDIADYLDTTEVAFPNTIILAANFREDDGTNEEREDRRWHLENGANGSPPFLVIPAPEKNAVIVDGQHRLFAFSEANVKRLEMNLVCSVFIDLPRQYQALLFATINSTQKPVDKSLTYELFGFNVEEEPPEAWSPDKVAVFLTRKLNTERDSPFFQRVLVAAENDFALTRSEARAQGQWAVSTATVVEGISRLISNNPKRDANTLMSVRVGRSRDLLRSFVDPSPLRLEYLRVNDKLLHTLVKNYFAAADAVLFSSASKDSFIFRTVGVQALFDVLRALVPEILKKKDLSKDFFAKRLVSGKPLDFADPALRSASGAGRVRIRRFLLVALGLMTNAELDDSDRKLYSQIRR